VNIAFHKLARWAFAWTKDANPQRILLKEWAEQRSCIRNLRGFGFVPRGGSWCLCLLIYWMKFALCAFAQTPATGYLSDEIKLVDNVPVDSSARDVIVLIHGWTGRNSVELGYSSYSDSPEWTYLISEFRGRLSGSNQKLYVYHWEQDASTGSWNPLTNFDAFGYGSATVAAVRAYYTHGPHLAGLLTQGAPNLHSVHFIAHSAGSWTAREAASKTQRLSFK
jgi:hypothetical protein